MPILNRIMLGTINGGNTSQSLFAVYDPFFEAIQIEINGRTFTSWDKPTQCRHLRDAIQYADDVRHLLVERYNHETDKAYGMYRQCIDELQRLTA